MLLSPSKKRYDKTIIGNKAYGLSEISDFEISKYFVVPTTTYEEFVSDKTTDKIKEILHNCKSGDGEKAAKNIQQIFKDMELPNHLLIELRGISNKLKSPFAVRSSSTLEDTELSFAGIFDSYLFVNNTNLQKRVKDVYISLFNARAIEYSISNRINLSEAKMAVIIQEMIINAKYGVAFCFEDDGKPITVIECGTGDPNVVTSGKSQMIDRYILTADGQKKKYPYKYMINSLFDFELDILSEGINKLSKIEFPLDLEWALKDGKLYILQLRHLTKNVPIIKGETENGIPASKGEKIGIVRILKIGDYKAEENITKEHILVAEEILIERSNIVKKAGGVCMECSGLLDHAAILAREDNIPCVTGLNGITKIVKDGEKLYMNGSTGEVKLLDRKSISIKREISVIDIIPAKLEPFRFEKHFVLLYENDSTDSVIMFHILNKLKDKKQLTKILSIVSQKTGKLILDGGDDIWYEYANIIETEQWQPELKFDLEHARVVGMNGNIVKIKDEFNILMLKVEKIYAEAAKKFSDYKKSHIIKEFEEAFLKVEVSNSYRDIIKNLLNKFTYDLIYKSTDIEKKRLGVIIFGMQNDNKLKKITLNLYDLIDVMITEAKRLGVDKRLYSSNLTFIECFNDKKYYH